VFADLSFAKASALSLPAIPRCPGTHTRVTLLRFARSISFCLHSQTYWDLVWCRISAFKAAWLSDRMWIHLPR
jgi:hypothetical protein